MPRITKAILASQNAHMEIELRETREGYRMMIEELQALCHEFGCLGGQNRIDFLRTRLRSLSEALRYSRCLSDARGTTNDCIESGVCGCTHGLLLSDYMEQHLKV